MEEPSFFSLSNRPTAGGGLVVQLMSTPRVQFLLLLVLSTFLFTIKLDNGGIMAFDECFYAQKAKEIVTSGDWLTQHFAGKPDHLNPWLHMWTIAASFKLFGVSDWAARFPTCVESVLIVLLTYLLAQYILKAPFFAFLSASMLLGNDFFYRFARKAHTDHLMALFFLAAIIMYILGSKGNRLWFLGMGVSIALAMLTKSVLGLLPLAVIGAHILVTRRWGVLWHPAFIASVAIALALGSTWYVYEYVNFKEQFLRYHLGWQVYSFSGLGNVSSGRVTAVGFLAHAIRNGYGFLRDAHVWLVLAVVGCGLMRAKRAAGDGAAAMAKDTWSLLALWLFLPTAVMSMAGQFKGWYLMPVFVPVAIFGAGFFYRLFPTAEKMWRVSAIALVLLLVHFSILVVTPLFSLDVKHELRHPGIRKLATKVRMLDLEPGMKVVHFPATRELAAQHGLQTGFFSYFSIAFPWLFYSDHPLFDRSAPASLEEARRYMDVSDGVCLTTEEGFAVISEHGALPYEAIGRARDRSMTYVICCSRSNFMRWRDRIETDYSRPPLYDLRQY
jgi:4-amino-4-deoxy-L-arabinose transferase-like glycosyltransferase